MCKKSSYVYQSKYTNETSCSPFTIPVTDVPSSIENLNGEPKIYLSHLGNILAPASFRSENTCLPKFGRTFWGWKRHSGDMYERYTHTQKKKTSNWFFLQRTLPPILMAGKELVPAPTFSASMMVGRRLTYCWWKESWTNWDVYIPIITSYRYIYYINWCRISSINSILSSAFNSCVPHLRYASATAAEWSPHPGGRTGEVPCLVTSY